MKNKMYIFLSAFLITLLVTGCSGKKVEKEKLPYALLGLSEEYVWVSKNGENYDLINLSGEVMHSFEDKYVPISKVINNYFFLEEKETKKVHLYNMTGEELFNDSDKIEIKTAHTGNKFTNEFTYAVTVWHTINENENQIKVYLLNDELTEITNNYVSGNYALTNMYHVNDADGIERPDLLVNPTINKFYEYYIKFSDGTFTLLKNNSQLYEPVTGSPILDTCGSYDVVTKMEGKYYIVKEDGAITPINYIPQGYSIDEYCDGYIIVSAKFVNTIKETKKQARLFDPSGVEITVIKKAD